MRAKTKSGSQDGFKRAVLCTLWVRVGGDIRLNQLQNIVFISIVILVSDTVSVVNISSAESLPTEESTPEINQIVSNALLVSSEKEKIKVVKRDTSPKA